MKRIIIAMCVAAIYAAPCAAQRTTTTYRGLSVRTPAPFGAAGEVLQANFKTLADRLGNHVEAADDPTADDDSAGTGGEDAVMSLSTWRNTADNGVFLCLDASEGAAVWVELTGDGAGGGGYTAGDYLSLTGSEFAVTPATIPIADLLGYGTMASQGADAVAITGGNATLSTMNATHSPHVSVQAYGAVGDGVTDDTTAFVNAASQADSLGYDYVYAPPGTYHCPGMVSDDMSDLYIVGDGVDFTATTYVAAFTRDEWRVRGSFPRPPASNRGMIAIEVDGPYDSQWTGLFPLAKEMGVTMGYACQTQDLASYPWVKECWRHGFEISSHSEVHGHMTTFTEEELRSDCVASKAAIQAITGAEDIAFVYPYHDRNATTDDIISQYFTRGRGVGYDQSLSIEDSHKWLVSGVFLDEVLTDPLPPILKQRLREIAEGNRKMLGYMHYETVNQPRLDGLRAMILYAKNLGIQFVNPSQLVGDNNYILDPQFGDPDQWVLNDAVWTWDTDEAYGGSARCAKYTPTGVESSGKFYADTFIRGSRPGKFSVYKVSFRYKCSEQIDLGSADGGFSWLLSLDMRDLDGALSYLGTLPYTRNYPGTAYIPSTSGEYVKVEGLILVPPKANGYRLWLQLGEVAANEGAVYVDDVRAELVDYISCRKISTTLNGRSGRVVYPGCAADQYGVSIIPRARVAGQLYSVVSGATCTIYSTDSGDSGSVDILVYPLQSYSSYPDFDTAAATTGGSPATIIELVDNDASETIDWTAGTTYQVTTDSTQSPLVLAFTDPSVDGEELTLAVVQDSTGGVTTTWPSAKTIYWPGGAEPAQNTAANNRAIYHFRFIDGVYYAIGSGSLGQQNAFAVDINGGAIDGTPIGSSSRSTGEFSSGSFGQARVEGYPLTVQQSVDGQGYRLYAANGISYLAQYLTAGGNLVELTTGSRYLYSGSSIRFESVPGQVDFKYGGLMRGFDLDDSNALRWAIDSATGNFTTDGTFDGRDVSADGGKLDLIENNADVTDATNVDAAGAVMETDYNAQTVLAATADDTPAAVTLAEGTVLGRRSGGNVAAVTNAQLKTDLSLDNVANVDLAVGNTVGITIDGAGSEITTGAKGYVRIPFDCTIVGAYLLADQSGSVVVDVWKDTWANYPPTDADSITASAPPTLSTDDNGSDTTLTGWTTTVSAGDVIGFNVDSVSTITRLTLQLQVTRN